MKCLKKLTIFIFACLFITACSETKKISKTSSKATKYVIEGPSNAVSYVEKFKYVAVSESIRTGIPASIKLAQGILESGYGKSTLARKANNHFGIKCGGKQWKGKKYYLKSGCYRVFRSADDAFREHSYFIQKNARYDFLFKYKRTDYKKWAYGLKKAGYAQDPRYPKKLIELIERYKLYHYDK